MKHVNPYNGWKKTGTKICLTCREEKTVENFYMCKSSPLSYCKPCHQDRHKKRYRALTMANIQKKWAEMYQAAEA